MIIENGYKQNFNEIGTGRVIIVEQGQ